MYGAGTPEYACRRLCTVGMFLWHGCVRLSLQTRIVLLKEFQQGFPLDTDTEIGIFQFGSGHISVCLHQFLVAAVHLHPNLVNRTVDSLRFGTLARSTVVLHIPQNGVELPFCN